MFATTLLQLCPFCLACPLKPGSVRDTMKDGRARSNPREAKPVSIESRPSLKTYDFPSAVFCFCQPANQYPGIELAEPLIIP